MSGLALILGLVPSVGASGADRPIVLLSADALSATVELNLPDYRIIKKPSGYGWEDEVSLPGWSCDPKPGAPKLPLAGALLQVPAGGSCRVSVLESEFDVIPGYTGAALPRMVRQDDGQIVAVEARDAGIYGGVAFYPGRLAELEKTVILRGIPVARLLMRPFQWNPGTRELRVYRRIRVRIEFDRPLGRMSGESGGEINPLAPSGRGRILNRIGDASPGPAPVQASGISRQAGWTKGIRIETTSRGIVRVSYDELVAQGLPQGQNASGLKLLNQGREVAFHVQPSAAGGLRSGQGIEFYAEPVVSDHTLANAYWLTWEDGGGPQMALRPAAPAGGESVGVFRDSVRLEVNAGIWYQTPGAPAADFWFWTRLTAPMEYMVPLALPEDALMDGHEMTIRTAFQGRSSGGHRTSIGVNFETWGDERWEGARPFVQTASAPQSEAKIGSNIIRIKAPGVPGTIDVSYLNWIEIRFWRSLTARGDAIEFDCEDLGARTIEVGGFSSAEIEVFDVTDPARPAALSGFDVVAREGKYAACFGDSLASGRRYFAATAARLGQAAKVEGWKSGLLLDTARQADLIIIAPRELDRAAAALAAFRITRRVRTACVAVEDIYNEFSWGIVDPASIKEFLAFAYRRWTRPAPAYVILLGDTTIDPKGYLANGRSPQIPAFWEWTEDLGLTPSDNSYVCLDGDDLLPDMMIGRIPGGPAGEAEGTIGKLLATDVRRQTPIRRVLLVADNDEQDFEIINDQVVAALPSGYVATKVYLRAYGSPADATAAIAGAVNEGVDLVSYVGHGSATDWGSEQIFGVSKMALLTNAHHLPLVCTFNCLNGFFSGTSSDCLAEAVVGAADKGAYASFSPSGLGYPWEHSILLNEMMSALFESGLGTLGAITTQAKITAYGKGVSADILKMFTLFGDPTMRAPVK